jgi:hypothetical protein
MDVDLKHFRGLYILENNPHPPSRGDNSLSFGGKIIYVCEDGRGKCEGKRRKLATLETLMTCLFHPQGLDYLKNPPKIPLPIFGTN